MTEFLLVTGYRTMGGFDCADMYALEAPSQLREILLRAADPVHSDGQEKPFDATPVRAKVADANRVEFDDLLSEARHLFRLKDERVIHGDAVACGLTRRALLAAGDRLVARGLVGDREHAVLASQLELQNLLHGEPSSIAGTLQERFDFRRTYTVRDAPASIGVPSWQPPVEWLPESVQRVALANLAFGGAASGATRAGEPSAVTKGMAASSGTYQGTARLVRGPVDFDRIREGDVVVTTSTSPAFTAVLPLIRALVTDVGGPLSHAAIVAREFGIPAIVGCGNATSSIPDGATVLVDTSSGTVTVVT